jgi:hypothetical protein
LAFNVAQIKPNKPIPDPNSKIVLLQINSGRAKKYSPNAKEAGQVFNPVVPVRLIAMLTLSFATIEFEKFVQLEYFLNKLNKNVPLLIAN